MPVSPELVTLPRNEHVGGKLKVQYAAARTAVVEACSNAREQKNAKRLLGLLRDLTPFNMEPALFTPLLALLGHENGKIARLVYCLLTELARSEPEVVNDAARVKFLNDVSGTVLAKRVVALRTVSQHVFTTDEQFDESVLPVVMTLLSKCAAFDEKQGDSPATPKKSRFGSNKARNFVLDRNFIMYACMSTIRLRVATPTANLFDHVLRAVRSPERIGARHAMALLHKFALQNAKFVAEKMRKMLPQNVKDDDPRPPNMTDTFTKVYFIHICALFANNARAHGLDTMLAMEYYQAMSNLAADRRDRVAFEAVQALSQGKWEQLASGVIRTDASTTPLLPEILIRLAQALAQPNVALLHEAIRVSTMLAKAYMLSVPDKKSGHDASLPLHSLNDPLRKLLKHRSHFIRLQVLKSMIWMNSHDDPRELKAMIRAELERNTMPSRLLDELLLALHDRVVATPAMADTLLEMTHAWCTLVPAKVEPKLLLGTWESVMGFSDEARVGVLRVIFDVLDFSPVGEADQEALRPVEQSIFWFLGEHATRLTNDAPERYLPKSALTNEAKGKDGRFSAGGAAGAAARNVRASSARAMGLVRRGPGSSRAGSSVARSSAAGSDSSPAVSVSGSEAAAASASPAVGASGLRPSLGALHNVPPVVHAVLLRLEQAATFASWETRLVCLSALIKIALKSSDPVRVRIYGAIALLVQEKGACFASVALPCLQLLDQMFAARQAFLALRMQRAKLADEELSQLYSDHCSIVNQIDCFTSVNGDVLPLGPESKPYLEEYWARFGASAAAPAPVSPPADAVASA